MNKQSQQTIELPEGMQKLIDIALSLKASEPRQEYLPNESEIDIIRHLVEFPNIAKYAAENLAPHRICHYMYELVGLFNKFYDENKVLVKDTETRWFRLHLVKLVSEVLERSMNMIGIETVDRM